MKTFVSDISKKEFPDSEKVSPEMQKIQTETMNDILKQMARKEVS